MDEVRFNRKDYTIYTVSEAKNLGIKFKEEWRGGKGGEWVKTDTDWVVPVLASGIWGRTPWVRTPCGTFPARKNDRLTHRPREDRWRLGGRPPAFNVTRRVRVFAKYLARTNDIEMSYRLAFPEARSRRYIKNRGNQLAEVPAVQKIVEDERRVILRELGIDIEAVLADQKKILDLLEGKDDASSLALRHRINLHFYNLLREMQPVSKFSESEEMEFSLDEIDNLQSGAKRRRRIERELTVRGPTDKRDDGEAEKDRQG